ncbi:MAG TPA: hypothetical protein PK079_12870 [Leptospiraceae bacterium]|nr:hypothetical protein [Leptospiraceae bacterium]HMW04878.1 hypothetical protein [Leptospiraceae bacterium]HMX32561.1 hypothetical protein [Leptospiraceae bacterium]HMY30901.1 hypothetical protein [Leptospiraceae bacterium]HMZ62705.1 hypothetical protein [Leptospiraceae bacterium]
MSRFLKPRDLTTKEFHYLDSIFKKNRKTLKITFYLLILINWILNTLGIFLFVIVFRERSFLLLIPTILLLLFVNLGFNPLFKMCKVGMKDKFQPDKVYFMEGIFRLKWIGSWRPRLKYFIENYEVIVPSKWLSEIKQGEQITAEYSTLHPEAKSKKLYILSLNDRFRID